MWYTCITVHSKFSHVFQQIQMCTPRNTLYLYDYPALWKHTQVIERIVSKRQIKHETKPYLFLGTSSTSVNKGNIEFTKYLSSSTASIPDFSFIPHVHVNGLWSFQPNLPTTSFACENKSILNFWPVSDWAWLLSWKWRGRGSPVELESAMIVGEYEVLFALDYPPLISSE